MKIYLYKYQYQSITVDNFYKTFNEFIEKNVKNFEDKQDKIDWDMWLKTPGIPKIQLDFNLKVLEEAK